MLRSFSQVLCVFFVLFIFMRKKMMNNVNINAQITNVGTAWKVYAVWLITMYNIILFFIRIKGQWSKEMFSQIKELKELNEYLILLFFFSK